MVIQKYLFVQQVHSELQCQSPHVALLQSGGDIQVELEELVLSVCGIVLFALQCVQKSDEPLEGILVTVDPEKVNLQGK